MQLNSINSKVDSDYEVNAERAVISLIRNKDHAVIMLERIKNGEYTVSLIDFLPVYLGGGHTSYIKEILKDNTYDGIVRMQSYTASEIANLELLSLNDFLMALKARRAPPPRFEITADKAVRGITAVQVQEFVDYVVEQQTNPPKFNVYGKDVARVVNESEHNSTTWAIEALKEIKIELSNSNYCQSFFPTKAQDYTKGNEQDNANNGCLIL